MNALNLSKLPEKHLVYFNNIITLFKNTINIQVKINNKT